VFTESRREELRRELLRRARDDDRIVGAAITGSSAEGREDAWSDIDLFFGVRAGIPVADVVDDWSGHCYARLGAVHHFTLDSGASTYRAFLLADGLQADLGFAPEEQFGPVGAGAFAVMFGRPAPRRATPPDTDFLVGMVWHHVLHARASIERGRLWAAEHWITALRDVTLTLASIRHDLPHSYARGADDLPTVVTAPIRASLMRELTTAEARRALLAGTAAALAELPHVEPAVAEKLGALFQEAVSRRDG
jgi:hypothetical protein